MPQIAISADDPCGGTKSHGQLNPECAHAGICLSFSLAFVCSSSTFSAASLIVWKFILYYFISPKV